MSVEFLELDIDAPEAEGLSDPMAKVSEEVDLLQQMAQQMKNKYAAAAAASDLTFIKIIEDKYGELLLQLSQLSAMAEGKASNFPTDEEEGEPDGR